MIVQSTRKKNNFVLCPIGIIFKEGGYRYISILSKFKKALLRLSLFSHALIIWRYDAKKETGNAGLAKIRNPIPGSPIRMSVVKIFHIDEDKGYLVTDEVVDTADISTTPDYIELIDIKPYFPVEDRVKECSVPESLANLGDCKMEHDAIDVHHLSLPSCAKEISLSEKWKIQAIGVLYRKENKCLFQMEEESKDYLSFMTGFSHLRLFWWFHRFDNVKCRRTTQCHPPYENSPLTGIFASRSPVRPNPIGTTVVKVLKIDVEKGTMEMSDIDAFDNTPVLDCKPYIPFYERVRNFDVPRLVSHWPSWFADERDKKGRTQVSIQPGDGDRLLNFQCSRPTSISVSPSHRGDKRQTEEMEPMDSSFIVVKEARQNNLKNVSVSIPKKKFTVLTGVSGSGKSSLAFDVIYAESHRRFLESLSTINRQSFGQMPKPEVDHISALPPAIAIEQKNNNRNPRSTVGTITEIYDFLRLLFSRLGTRHCPKCGRSVHPQSALEITHNLENIMPGISFEIRIPRTTAKENTQYSDNAKNRDNAGNMQYANNINDMDNVDQNPDNIIGRFENTESQKSDPQKVQKAVEMALNQGNGFLELVLSSGDTFILTERNACFYCDYFFFTLTSSCFSYNNPEGMCSDCHGLGIKLEVDENLVIRHPKLSVLDGASPWWGELRKHLKNPTGNWMKSEVFGLAQNWKINLETPWQDLPEDFRHALLYGSGEKEVHFTYQSPSGRSGEIVKPALGAINHIKRLFKETSGEASRQFYMQFMSEQICPTCEGEKLSQEARLVSIAGTRYPTSAKFSISELLQWLSHVTDTLDETQLQIGKEIIGEIRHRAKSFLDLGVGYLTLDRSAPTLSGGEMQRIRLASQLGCGLMDILYVLDEPSSGMHAKDLKLLLHALQKIRDLGNTVLVVEHDADTMLAADYLIDLGPGAGRLGGKIVAQGTPAEVASNPNSLTGKYLRMKMEARQSQPRENLAQKSKTGKKVPEKWLTISGVRTNNLKNVTARFPLGLFTCIVGVSGSGKSSLVSKTLYPVLENMLKGAHTFKASFDKIEGVDNLDKVIYITQAPIGRTPRSNPATYVGFFDDIRHLFAKTKEAIERGYKPNRFSFNNKEGCCEKCQGEGKICIEMHFMPDVWMECSECKGKRFNKKTLEITLNGKTVADILDMDVLEASEFFKGNKKIHRYLKTMCDVGLEYLKLGQSALTLSGGEAQRVKLSKELSSQDSGRFLYIMDEPSSGLHFEDIRKLLAIIDRLTQAGNTVIVVEHNQDIIASADWVIELGPEGGSSGGYILSEG